MAVLDLLGLFISMGLRRFVWVAEVAERPRKKA